MGIKQTSRMPSVAGLVCRIIAIGTVLTLAATTAAAASVIVTRQGRLTGIETPTMNEYLGIPYAAAPVGRLRWRPPHRHAHWHGVLQATQFGNNCPQPGFGSEDCLYLNIYTPPGPKNQYKHHKLPVMVWIHGGSLVTGGGDYFDPQRIIEQSDVIVVTINYRLGILGFFAHPAIDAERHRKGNYGLMDQQFALKWIKHNIRAFGGNPHRVTIFGESAGGQSVYANLASPTAARLFQRAISQSGAFREFQDYFDYIVPLAQAESVGTAAVPSGIDIATSVGCADQTGSCLRAVPASALVAAEPGTAYPFVDGSVLKRTPEAAFASGKFNRVPVITGGNHDEYRLFVAGEHDAEGNPLTTLAEYEQATEARFGSTLGMQLYTSLYPLASYPNAGVALSTSTTDAFFACPERNAVRLLSKFVRTYAYEFNDEEAYLVFDLIPSPPYPPITFPLGSAHLTEVPYLFDVYSTPSNFTTEQKRLSHAMISYWTNFAAQGDPNSAAVPQWSPYDSTTDQFQSLVAPSPTVESTFDSDHKCSFFWDTL
jgi:para-nitrobenzyl esterase